MPKYMFLLYNDPTWFQKLSPEEMQAATESDRPASSFQNNWGSEIKVEIPETGLTFGELDKLLRDKFGHASHVSGEKPL